MKRAVFYSWSGACVVLIHIGFVALHRWIGGRLEIAAAAARSGTGRWWVAGALAFFVVFVLIAIVALRLSGKSAVWLPKPDHAVLLFGSATLSAVLLETSALLDLARVHELLSFYHLAFVSTLLFECGFILFFVALIYAMLNESRYLHVGAGGRENPGTSMISKSQEETEVSWHLEEKTLEAKMRLSS